MDWEIGAFAGGCAAFLVLAILGSVFFSWISFPSAVSLGVYLLGTALIVGGYFVGRRVKIPPYPLLWGTLLLVVVSAYLYPIYGFKGLVAAYLLIAALVAVIEGVPGKELAGLGIAAFVVNFYYYGVPLLEPASRGGYTVLGALGLILLVLGVNSLADKRDKNLWLLFGVGVVLTVLSGYRGAVVLLVLSALITLNLSRRIDWKRWVVYLGMLLVIILALGQVNAFVGESNPAALVVRRAGFTYEVYDNIVNTLTPQYGLWFAREPRYIVGDLVLGEHKIINPGLFGFLWLEGGLIGVISGCILVGMVLGHMRQNRDLLRVFYGILWVYVLISIETGFDIVYLSGFLGALFAISWERSKT